MPSALSTSLAGSYEWCADPPTRAPPSQSAVSRAPRTPSSCLWIEPIPNSPTSIPRISIPPPWILPHRANVRSLQYCHYIVPGGEADVDQARRGFEGVADLSKGTVDVGTKSAKQLVDGVTGVNEALVTLQEVVKPGLSVLASTVVTTAILETGTQSLDGKRKATEIAQNGGKCDMK
ncbi:MAG: hypothetical protein M1821_008016 [Bathelium mastoideum]|nr:MAG: hypothetical protein M1821_008016 [Bathelium mastoideum]